MKGRIVMQSDHRDRARIARRGFTIIEVIVIVVILGIIAAVIAPRLLGRIGQSRQAVAKSNAVGLANSVKLFMADHSGVEPGSSITILYERPSNVEEGKYKPYVDNADQLKDPWGRLYILVMPGQKNVDFDIVSYGLDGQPGGTDENADIIVP
jgi:general secretion pathway protein G